MDTFDWKAEAAKPGVSLMDVEGVPVLRLSDARYVYAIDGGSFSGGRAMMSGATVSRGEFEALMAYWESHPKLKA
ncbi:MAG: hypothetical protein JNK55_01015 [Rubrivivax sp.]|nr:hypothetical protein [Rubrivivax sp.]